MDEQMILAPASVPQEQFLASTSTITLYAGAQGAGKTFAVVLNMVKFAAMKNSTIVCFRRTMGEMKDARGIWQEAVPIFRKMFQIVRLEWTSWRFMSPLLILILSLNPYTAPLWCR